MSAWLRHIATGQQLHDWLAFCTQWACVAGQRGHPVNGFDLPPDLCALAFWPEEKIDTVLQALELLACGGQLRSLTAARFRQSYPYLQLAHLRWALQQLAYIETRLAGADDEAVSSAKLASGLESPAQGRHSVFALCSSAEGRKALLWCGMVQCLPEGFAVFAEPLAHALALAQLPSDPYRVWIAQSAWANLLEMSTGGSGESRNNTDALKGVFVPSRKAVAGKLAGKAASGSLGVSDVESGDWLESTRQLAIVGEHGNLQGVRFMGDRHAVGSMQDIDRVRA